MALWNGKFNDDKSIQDKVWQYVLSHPELLPRHSPSNFENNSFRNIESLNNTITNHFASKLSDQFPDRNQQSRSQPRKSLLDHPEPFSSFDRALSELSLINHNLQRWDKFSQLSEDIKSYVSLHCQSQQILDKKLNLRTALSSRIQKEFPRASVHLVGSSCNGFACDDSDADFCVMFNEGKRSIPNSERNYLYTIERIINDLEPLRDIEFVSARVPILKFKDTICECTCDLSVNNAMGIRNVHLLRAYSKIDKRVKPLVVVVKKWARARNINDASQGTLSSYAIILMVLHFLQCGCQPPVLQSLQQLYPQHFRDDSIVDNLPFFEPTDQILCNDSKNKESVGGLLIGFFNYFSERFSWENIMSVYYGCVLPRRNYKHFTCRFINVEEPFEFYNTARTIYNQSSFVVIKEEFRRANARLKEKPLLGRLF